MTASKLYWASIGGQKTEPVRVVEEKGKRVFYSIGCNDPHEMEGVELLGKITDAPLSKRSRAAQEAANTRWEAYQRGPGQWTGYRQWD